MVVLYEDLFVHPIHLSLCVNLFPHGLHRFTLGVPFGRCKAVTMSFFFFRSKVNIISQKRDSGFVFSLSQRYGIIIMCSLIIIFIFHLKC